jgi:hypothetical protein
MAFERYLPPKMASYTPERTQFEEKQTHWNFAPLARSILLSFKQIDMKSLGKIVGFVLPFSPFSWPSVLPARPTA